MRFVFTPSKDAHRRPAHHLADVDLLFDEDPFAGLRIVGLSVWARANGAPGMSVTFPSQKVPSEGDKEAQYFDYIRQMKGSKALRNLKDAILADFVKTHPDIGIAAGAGEESYSVAQQGS